MSTGELQKRLENALFQAADALLFEGTNPWELDEAAVEFGFRVGPCEMQDLLGLDTVQQDRTHLGLLSKPIPILPRMLQEGRLGKKVGVGWYRYPGGGGRVIDPLIEDLIREECYFAKVSRDDMSDGEIDQRLRQALTEEIQRLIHKDGYLITDVARTMTNHIGVSLESV